MDEALLDPEAWEMMKSMAGRDFLVELIDVYLIDSPGLIQQMRSGLEAGDIDSVRRAAHTLKSNSASFGANRLANAARDLEMMAKGGALEGAVSRLNAIELEYSHLAPYLEELKHEC